MPYHRVNGKRIYFEWTEQAGEFQPVVFLHDGLGSTRSWGKLPGQVGKALGASSLNYDRWGYGKSSPREEFSANFLQEEADFLEIFLDSLGIGSVHLVGHSDGASIALLFASSHRDRVLSLVAEAPHTFVEPISQVGLLKLVKNGPEQLLWLARFHPGRWRELFQSWTLRWLAIDHADWDMRPCLADIEAPILVIQGDSDEFGTLAQVAEIEQLAQNASSWVLPQCGHVPHKEYSEDFWREVVDHIRRASYS